MKHGVLLYKFTAFRDILDLITRNSCIQLINLKLVSKTNLLLVLTFYDIFRRGEEKLRNLLNDFLILLVLCSIFNKMCSWGKEKVKRRMGKGSDFW